MARIGELKQYSKMYPNKRKEVEPAQINPAEDAYCLFPKKANRPKFLKIKPQL